MSSKRYGIRLSEGWLPYVEITTPTLVRIQPYTVHHERVRRVYGITRVHAWNRALRWTREHGDPR